MTNPYHKNHLPSKHQATKGIFHQLKRYTHSLFCFSLFSKPTAKPQKQLLSPQSSALSTILLILFALSLLAVPSPSSAKSRYVTIKYTTPEALREFNDNLTLTRDLSRMIKRRNIVTIEDEVYAKTDIIVEKVEVVLDMFPKSIQFDLVIVPTRREVAGIYKKNYGKSADHIAYYSLSQKTIYISADDTNLRVLAHEIGHMVVDHFFQVRPPYNIHELMAQFAEKHVTD